MNNDRITELKHDGRDIAENSDFNSFHHVGIIVDQRPENSVFVESTRCWVTPVEDGVEKLYFEPDSPSHEMLKENHHFCFAVQTIDNYIDDYEVLLPPFAGAWGRAVFLNIDGRVIELLEDDEHGQN